MPGPRGPSRRRDDVSGAATPGLLHGCDLLHTAIHRLWVTSPGGYAACIIVVHSPPGAVVRGVAAAGQCGCVKAAPAAPGRQVRPRARRVPPLLRPRTPACVDREAQIVHTRYRRQRPRGCYPGAGLIAHGKGRHSCRPRAAAGPRLGAHRSPRARTGALSPGWPAGSRSRVPAVARSGRMSGGPVCGWKADAGILPG